MTSSLRCSVIVPVYNGVHTIVRCLDALAKQTVSPDEYEVIVVDDGSLDATAEQVRRQAQRHPALQITVLQQANAGPAAARNHGACHASAPILLFTDADCAPEPTWVAAMLAPFADPGVTGAKGAYLSDQTELSARFVQAEYEDRYQRMTGLEQIDFIDTYSAAYRRDVFLENGGFDVIFTTASVEDQEFSFRIAQKGYRLVFAPAARVKHIHDRTWHEYARRKYYIGFWKALLTRWHPERIVNDSHTPQVLKVQILLAAALLGLLLLTPLAQFQPIFTWVWAGVAAVVGAFLVTALPFLAQLARRSIFLALYGIPMLVVRAAALGAGYVYGNLHFAGTLPGQRRPVIPGWKQAVKRGIDIVGGLCGLLVAIPVIVVAAPLIALDSPGPVFFRQVRIGQNGRPFRIFKLRSMRLGAEEQVGQLIDLAHLSQEPAFKVPDDPRVTRVGRFLRRTSMDELPQFFNVLRGEMSLVGPRPEEESVVGLYNDYQRRRLAVKPGLTGPMQVNGRGSLTFSARLALELDYIEHYSLWVDLTILARTLPVVFRGKGAH